MIYFIIIFIIIIIICCPATVLPLLPTSLPLDNGFRCTRDAFNSSSSPPRRPPLVPTSLLLCPRTTTLRDMVAYYEVSSPFRPGVQQKTRPTKCFLN